MTDREVSTEEETAARVRSGQCLVCHRRENNRRGLCQSHYQQFLRIKYSLPTAEAKAFEQKQIRKGRILPVGRLRQIRSPNPFSNAG